MAQPSAEPFENLRRIWWIKCNVSTMHRHDLDLVYIYIRYQIKMNKINHRFTVLPYGVFKFHDLEFLDEL